jgi:peptide deformylase
VRIEVDGWRARIMQHEFDHLDGILYVDRLDDGDWKTVQKIARKRGWGRPGRPGRRESTTSTPDLRSTLRERPV